MASLRQDCRAVGVTTCWEASGHVVLVLTDSLGLVGTSVNIGANNRAGANWQAEVRRRLETMYDSSRYDIVENHSLKNVNGKSVTINGRYVRPDFQIIDKATQRIVAIHEAKTGTLTYLQSKGQQVLTKYRTFAGRLNYKAPPVIPEFRTRSRPAGGGAWSKAFSFVFLMEMILQVKDGGPVIEMPCSFCHYAEG
jgi:hypothetical protein